MHARVRGTPPALRSAFVVRRHHLSIESIPNCLVWHAHVLVPRLYSRAICGGVDIATMRDPAQSGSEAGGGGGGQEPQPRRVSCDVTWHPTRDTRWAMGDGRFATISGPSQQHAIANRQWAYPDVYRSACRRESRSANTRRTRTHHHAARGDAARAFCVLVAIPMVVIELKITPKPALN